MVYGCKIYINVINYIDSHMCINYSLQSKNSKTMFIVYFCEFGMPYYLINLPKCNLTTNVNLYPTDEQLNKFLRVT